MVFAHLFQAATIRVRVRAATLEVLVKLIFVFLIRARMAAYVPLCQVVILLAHVHQASMGTLVK